MRLHRLRTYLIISSLAFLLAGLPNIVTAATTIYNPASCPAILPPGSVAVPYSYTFAAHGGGKSETWSILAGMIPPGTSLNPATGVLSGTPTTANTYTFTIQVAGTSMVSCVCTLTIGGGCAFVGANTGSISFINIDPSTKPGPISATASSQISFTCESGLAYTVTASPASGWTMVSGGNSIPYTLGFLANGVGLGATPIALLTTSNILQTDYANAAAGLYANIAPITLAVSWSGGSINATLPAGNVTGAIINNCLVTTAPGTMTFPIDPSIPGTTSATISPDMQINCTKGDTVTISASSQNGGAAPAIKCTTPAACGTSLIPYIFKILNSNAWPVSVPSASITGFGGAGLSLGLSGSVNSTDYANAPVGSYADVETITINY